MTSVPRIETSDGSDVRPTAQSAVALGGGHGLHASLSALRLLHDDLTLDQVTAVVTVADNGGSSGRLRGEFGVLPPGDLRMALAALCGSDEWGRTWADVVQHRFAGDGEMRGHVIGNLLIVGSIANVIVVDQARRLGVEIDWRTHARVGVPVTMATLAAAAAWLALI